MLEQATGSVRTGRASIRPNFNLLVFCCVLGALGIVGTLALAAPPASAAETTVLSRSALASIPDGDFIYRVHGAYWDPNDPPISMLTHAHGGGLAYTVEGTHVMTMEGHTMATEAGSAAWIPGQITHTHASDGKAITRILFMFALYPAAMKGTPLPPTVRNSTVEYESDVLAFTDRGAKDVVLSANTFSAGEAGGTQTYSGPTMLKAQSGSYTVKVGGESRTVQAGSYLTVQAGTPVQITAGDGGKVLALSIVPAGQPAVAGSAGAPLNPAGMPSTGNGSSEGLVWVALAVAAASLALGAASRKGKIRI